jgi:cold shock CspA family protein/nucleoside phosphorylase
MRRALIFTAKDVETAAVKEQLLGPIKVGQSSRATLFSIWYLRSSEDRERPVQQIEIGLYETGKGEEAAASACGPIIEAFDPDVVFYIGCAGGDPAHTNIGDVVVATAVWPYDKSSHSRYRTTPKGHPLYPDKVLIDAAKVANDFPGWRLRVMSGAGNEIAVKFGDIASGQKIIKETRSAIWKYIKSKVSDDVIACETEGHGFLVSVEPFKRFCLLVRGVSDHLSGKGDEGREADEQQQFASTSNAAAFTCHIIESLDYKALRRVREGRNSGDSEQPGARWPTEGEVVAITVRTSMDQLPAVVSAIMSVANCRELTVSRVESGSVTAMLGMNIHSASLMDALYEGEFLDDLLGYDIVNLISSARSARDEPFDLWLREIRVGRLPSGSDRAVRRLNPEWREHARTLARRHNDIDLQPQAETSTPVVIGAAKGVVKFFNVQKGFGFITRDDGGEDVFVHISAVEQAGLTGLAEGQPLDFTLVDRGGRVSATELRIEGDPLPVEDQAPQRDQTGETALGTVKFFNATKGFGFITRDDGQPDVFVHISAVERAGMISLNEGDRVQFEVEVDRRGKTAATNLVPIQ